MAKTRYFRPLVAGLAAAAAGFAGADSARAAARLQESVADGLALWPVLLTLLVTTLAVERGLELVWNLLEWLLLSFRAWSPAQLRAPHYVQFKSGASLLLGMILGLLAATYTGMRLVQYLEPAAPGFLAGVPETWDLLLTAALIGLGAKPLHELLGILTHLKNFLSGAALHQREAAAAALAESVLKMAQSDAQTMVDVPGIGPTRLNAPGGGVRPLDMEDEAAPSPARSEADRYIDLLRNRSAM